MPGSFAVPAAEAAAALMDHPEYIAELLRENAGVLQSNFCVMLPENIYTFWLHVGAAAKVYCGGLIAALLKFSLQSDLPMFSSCRFFCTACL